MIKFICDTAFLPEGIMLSYLIYTTDDPKCITHGEPFIPQPVQVYINS